MPNQKERMLPYVIKVIAEFQSSPQPYNIVSIVDEVEKELEKDLPSQPKRGRPINVAKHVLDVIEYGIKVHLLKNDSGRIVVNDECLLPKPNSQPKPHLSQRKPDKNEKKQGGSKDLGPKEENKESNKKEAEHSDSSEDNSDDKGDNENSQSENEVSNSGDDNTEDVTQSQSNKANNRAKTDPKMQNDMSTPKHNNKDKVRTERPAAKNISKKNSKSKLKQDEKQVAESQKNKQKKKVNNNIIDQEEDDEVTDSTFSKSQSECSTPPESLTSGEDIPWSETQNSNDDSVVLKSHLSRVQGHGSDHKRKRSSWKTFAPENSKNSDENDWLDNMNRKRPRTGTPIPGAFHFDVTKQSKVGLVDHVFSNERVSPSLTISRRNRHNCSNPNCLCNLAEKCEQNDDENFL